MKFRRFAEPWDIEYVVTKLLLAEISFSVEFSPNLRGAHISVDDEPRYVEFLAELLPVPQEAD